MRLRKWISSIDEVKTSPLSCTIKRLHFAALGGLADVYTDTGPLARNRVVFTITQQDRVIWPEFVGVSEVILVYEPEGEL